MMMVVTLRSVRVSASDVLSKLCSYGSDVSASLFARAAGGLRRELMLGVDDADAWGPSDLAIVIALPG